MLDEFLGSLHKDAVAFPKDYRWLNVGRPISMDSLRGHVVILDFWTYCCINCMHMLPVLERLEEKYKGLPFVVVGVHTAKFKNEQDPKNIDEAINRYEVRHPVIVDEKMHLWKSYGVNAWPTLIIIDPAGKIAYRLAGESKLEDLDGLVSHLLEKGKRERTLAKKRMEFKIPEFRSKSVLKYPGKLAFSPDEKHIAISDSGNNRVLIISADGKIQRIIGGERGFGDGAADGALFFRPQGIVWPEKNKIYLADTENHALREIDLEKGKVGTIAGTGKDGGHVMPKPGAKGRDTALSSPWDLAYRSGEIYIAMAGVHQIWKYEIKGGLVSRYAGSGHEGIEEGDLYEAKFAQPSGLALGKGHLYVADSEASGLRSVSFKTGFVSTLIGSGLFVFGNRDGAWNDARLQHPLGISAEGGRLYVADTYNNAIKLVDLESEDIKTLVSTSSKSECRLDDPNCDTLGLYEPSDVKISGNVLYIADTNNHLIRKYDLVSKVLTTLKIK